jgi:RHS repeat-associated protein
MELASAQTVVTDDQNRTLDDGLNSYTWSRLNALESRTPKSGGAAWTFASTWQGAYNQARLETGTDGTRSFSFEYDAHNQLTWLRHPDPAIGAAERSYDGDDMVLELRDTYGARQWARYVHGPNADQPLAFELYAAGVQPIPGTGQVYYYHADAEGSIRLVTDANAQIVNRYEYYSFGKRLSVVESVAQPYTWKGREWIGGGVDQYYNRARFYDPQLGRFTSEDPLGYDGGDTNLFAFTWSNPKNWKDPSGLSAASEYGIIAARSAAIGGMVGGVGAAIACVFDTLTASLKLGVELPDAIQAVDRTHCTVVAIKVP